MCEFLKQEVASVQQEMAATQQEVAIAQQEMEAIEQEVEALQVGTEAYLEEMDEFQERAMAPQEDPGVECRDRAGGLEGGKQVSAGDAGDVPGTKVAVTE